jgi:hypothetical protein
MQMTSTAPNAPGESSIQARFERLEKTCAACGYVIDANAITVKIGGRSVEVCCEECTQKLREASSAAKRA